MEALYILKSVLVPIVAIVTPLGVVLACLQFAQRRQDRLHQTIVGLIERGLPVPPQLLDPPRRPGMSPLMRALTLVGFGIGLVIFLYTLLGTAPYMPWAAGAIPLAIGIAQLVAIRLERTSHGRQPDASPAQP